MNSQITSSLVMVRPANFGFNAETAKNNFYQQEGAVKGDNINAIAQKEFDSFVSLLQEQGVNVIVVEDTPEPVKPDSIFPNNWFSTHCDGTYVLYPMYAKNRRLERRDDMPEILKKQGFKISKTVDLTHYESVEQFFEGTGSLILDRLNKIAYICRSQRSHLVPFKDFAKQLGYKTVDFDATQIIDGKESQIYHTNVMMHLGSDIVVVCLESVKDKTERENLVNNLKNTNKVIVDISAEQKFNFAGNMLEVANHNGDKFTVMSKTAYDSLTNEQISTIKKYTNIITPEIPTIEKLGGGSARCMMAEVFLPKE